MRIAYLAGSRIPSKTANSVHVMRMCNALAAQGHDVALYTPDYRRVEEGVEDVFSFYGVPRSFQLNKTPWPAVKGKAYISAVLQARRALAWGPDLVYGRSMLPTLVASQKGITTAYESHHPESHAGFLHDQCFRLLTKSSNFALLVVITEALSEHFQAVYDLAPDQIKVIPDAASPIEPTGADPLDATPEDAAPPIRVGYVGSLYKGRGLDLIQEVARSVPGIDFHIVGGAKDQVRRRARHAPENLEFHGHVPPAQVPDYLVAMDILLAPYQVDLRVADSDLDTSQWMSPLKIFEYMSAGKPIVCSDLPVLREVLDETVAVLCDPDDPQAWVGAVRGLAADEGRRTALGKRAEARLLEHHTWDRRAAAILSSLVDGS